MNKKVKRGGEKLLLVALILLITIIQSNSASSACCTHPNNFCQDVNSAQECCGDSSCDPAIFDPDRPCAETNCIQPGCCLQSCEKTLYSDCNYAFTFIWDLAPTYDCDSAPECVSGCCVYLTAENNIGFCERKPQLDCIEYELYPNTQFHVGMTEQECNELCLIGQTLTGIFSGKVLDNETNAPIPNVQIIVSGISAFTNIYGEFFMEDAPSGTPFIEVFATGYDPLTISDVTINHNETTNINISLHKTLFNRGTLTGYVMDEEGNPVFSYVYWSQGGEFTTIVGKYTISNVLEGPQEITAVADNYQTKTDLIEVQPNIINNFNLTLMGFSQEQLCGNDQLDLGEQCDGIIDDACPGVCTSDCVCPTSCLLAGGECYTWDFQCTAVEGESITIDGIDLCAASNYDDSSYGCCNTEIQQIPPCINGEQTNQPVSASDMTNTAGNICQCGLQYIDINNQELSSGYCCSNSYQQSNNPCIAFGTLTGYVIDGNSSEGIESATVKAKKIGTTEEYSTSTIFNGNYLLEVQSGQYSLIATRQGYTYNTTTLNILPAEIKINNLTLNSIVVGCTETSIAKPIASITQSQGIKDISLSWEHPCKSYVDRFEIYRNGQHISTHQQSDFQYIDTSTEWDMQYEYYIKVYSIYNLEESSNLLAINTGSQECENKFEDESWCIDTTKRVVCDEKNNPVLWDGSIRNSPNGDCLISQGNSSICQMENDESWCTKSEENCLETGIGKGNIFGLYYNLYYELNQFGCLEDKSQPPQLQQRYCYYDSYEDLWTTVDKCLNCDTDLSCYDYNTKEACLQDNCYAGPRNNAECKWHSTPSYFEKLGKGICYIEGYKGTDRCSLCSQQSEIFENTACSSDICTKLGRCYSNQDESSCIACEASTTCESYTTKQECISIEDVEFSKGPGSCESSRELILSQDNCGLGRCSWINDKCVKDGNADNADDCIGSQNCLRDNTAQFTSITNKPPYINNEGNAITFSTTGSTNATYYCIGEDCCPSTLIENNNIFLSGETPGLNNKEEPITLSYYSIDDHKNIEQVKETEIFIDTFEPNMEISYEITNSSSSETQSDLIIISTVTESSLCHDSLMPTSQSKLINALLSYNASVTYTGLEDATYLYTLTCTDLHQNTKVKNWDIKIDRIQKIFDELPYLQTIKGEDAILSIKTTDQYHCYFNLQGQIYTSLFNPSQSALGIPSGNDFYYESLPLEVSSGTHTYEIECRDGASESANIMDTSLITFTVDESSPTTTLFVLAQNGSFIEPQSTPYYQLTIKLDCTDTPQGPPLESGCLATKYCTSYGPCEPYTFYNSPKTIPLESGNYYFCYFSIDNLDNQEETNCVQFSIDHDSPTLSITSPLNMGLTSTTPYVVQGIWNDTSEVNIFVKSEDQHGILSESILADTSINGYIGEFSASIYLFEGYNKIIATAYDTLGNYFTTSINAYLDRVAPDISLFEIYDDYSSNNPDTDNILEYGQEITFELTANDYEWSDTNNEKLTDIHSAELVISCTEGTGCFNQNIILNLQSDEITQNYRSTYNPFNDAILAEGDYTISLTVEDAFENEVIKEDIFSVINSIEIIPKIYNHLDQQIDTLSYDAEFNYPIKISFDSNKLHTIDYVEVEIKNEMPSLYNMAFSINSSDNFTYIVTNQLPVGLYDVEYTVFDLFGVVYPYNQQFNLKDTIPPSFTITIHKEDIEINSVGYGTHEIIIEANEPLSSLDYLNYEFLDNSDSVHDITGYGSTWNGNLYIAPTAIYADLDFEIATLAIGAIDLNQMEGTEIISGSTFSINTMGPGAPQIFDPEVILTYTNQDQIYLTGASNEWEPNLHLFIRKNLASSDPSDPGWITAAETITEPINPILSKWESSVYGEITQNSETSITINDYSHLFNVGQFMEFSNNKPHDYLYYEITDIELYSDPEGIDEFYTIKFIPSIEEDIAPLMQDINIYNSKMPAGWFYYYLNLDQWNNNFAAQSQDQNGNYGPFSEAFTVIYDISPPEFHQLNPSPDSYTNEEQPLIGAKIMDIHGGVDEDTIIFIIDGSNFTCNQLSCQSNEDNSEIIISYIPEIFAPGWHNLSIIATDMAGNYGETSWNFIMDGLSPIPPIIELIPGNKLLEGSPYTYYSNITTPQLSIIFSELENININSLVIEGSNQNQIGVQLSQDSYHEFSAEFSQQLTEDIYSLMIYAIKQFPNGSWSDEANWKFNFIIDTTKPTIDAVISSTTNQQANIINISYIETYPYYLDMTGDIIQKSIDYTELYTPYQTIVNLTPELGIKNINISFSDKAGNIVKTSITTELDDIAPDISDNYEYDGVWVSTPQTIIITAEDPNGIKELKYCLISTCSPLEDGVILAYPYILSFEEDQETSVSYQAIDLFDNPSDIENFNVLIDSKVPSLTLSTFNTQTNSQFITVTGTYNDTNMANITFLGDIIPSTYFTTFNEGTYIQQIELTPVEGPKTITAKAYDYAGNTKLQSITVYLDLTSPALTIESIDGAILVGDYYLSDSDSLFITGNYLLADDLEIYPETRPTNKAEINNGQFTINITGLDGYVGQNNQETINEITLIAEEASGNKVNTTIIVIKDHLPPQITVINPVTLATNSLSPLIELSTHEPSSCLLEYWIAQTNYRSSVFDSLDLFTHYVQIIDILEENDNTLMNATCTDILSHTSTLNFSITTDTIAPNIFYVEVDNAELQLSFSHYFYYLLFMSDTTNLEVGANEYVRCKYGSSENYAFMEKFPNFDELEFSGQRISNTFQLPNGYHSLYVGCEDKAGNIGDISQVDIEVNTELPIQLTSINPPTYTNEQNPLIEFYTYRNATCIISTTPEEDEYPSRIFDYDSFTYVTSNAKTSKTFTGVMYRHFTQVSGLGNQSLQLTPLEDNQTYGFTVNCEAIEPNVNPSLPTDIIFTTDFTPPSINIDTPIDGEITNETVLIIQGLTEPLSHLSLQVNNELQLSSIMVEDGIIDTVAILSNGSNEIKINITDKATNQNSTFIYAIYNNIGPKIELLDPSSGDIINPIYGISTKLFQENNQVPHPQSTEFVLYTLNDTQDIIYNPGTLSTTTDTTTLDFISSWSPLPENKYRVYVVPISSSGIRGEGQNSLFEIKSPIPEIVLSSPYNSLPYKHLIVTDSQINFAGLISTEDLLFAELFINGNPKAVFNQKSFSFTTTLNEGINKFAIVAINLGGESGIKHGSLLLDSQGPIASITIE